MTSAKKVLLDFLTPGHASRLYDLLQRNASSATLLVRRPLLSELSSLYRGHPALPMITPQDLESENAAAQRTLIVADPGGEQRQVEQIRARVGHPRVYGLIEDLFPASLAGSVQELLEGTATAELPRAADQRIVLIFATPRSGSSLLCDILENMGCGFPKEHLRQPFVDVFKSGYGFSEARLVENLMRHASGGGTFATKLITHFVFDLLRSGRLDFVKLANPERVAVLGLDRSDKVLQAVSGFLASERGIWHLRRPRDHKRLEGADHVAYDFRRILSHYVRALECSAQLAWLMALFPGSVTYDYERDLVQNRQRTAQTLARWLGRPEPTEGQVEDNTRSKMGDDLNDDYAEQFRRDYARTFSAWLPAAGAAR